MDMTRAKYADAVHKSECKSTERLAHACGQHRAHETTLHATGRRRGRGPLSARWPTARADQLGPLGNEALRGPRTNEHGGPRVISRMAPNRRGGQRAPETQRGPAVIGKGLVCASSARALSQVAWPSCTRRASPSAV
jgi:hypothetical protein